MTKEEIIELGVQAGIHREVLMLGGNLELLTDFAKLVADKEREACAKIVEPDEEHRREASGFLGGEEGVELLDVAAKTIRARGQV